jgi:hypothetical protein
MGRISLVTSCIVFCFFLGCDITPGAGRGVKIEMQVTIEQKEETFEGYTAHYTHEASVARGGITLNSEISNTLWEGYETCQEPAWYIEWDSEIDFEDFRYNEPFFTLLEREGKAWILYEPALEFGVLHPGSPQCVSADSIPAGTWVAKNFFIGDLSDRAVPQGDFPVYYYDQELAAGGFVLATIPLESLESGQTLNFNINYQATEPGFSISLSVTFSVTPL